VKALHFLSKGRPDKLQEQERFSSGGGKKKRFGQKDLKLAGGVMELLYYSREVPYN